MEATLRERLTAFRAAYYRVIILRGLLLSLLWGALLFLAFSISEGAFWWEVTVKKVLWSIWMGGVALFLGRWVVYPLLQYGFRLRGYLSDEEAARWIGRRIPEVRDKLLNALQLSQQTESAAIALAIEERMRQLSVIPWEVALPTHTLRRYGFYLLGILGIAIFFWLVSPTFFRGGVRRFLQPAQAFARPLPYTLHIEGLKPYYRRGETLVLRLLLQGERFPAEIYASDDKGLIPLRRISAFEYELSMQGLQESFTLRIEAAGKLLHTIPIRVVRPPLLEDLRFVTIYPAYTGFKPDTTTQPTLRVLKGSAIHLSFHLQSERPTSLWAEGFSVTKEGHIWLGRIYALKDESYKLRFFDSLFSDSLIIQVESFSDAHPSVQLFSEWLNPDSWEQRLRLRLMDDYGFTRAVLWYRVAESATPGRAYEVFRSIPIRITAAAQQELSFTQQWQALGIQPGDKVEYYVEVWDNDAVSGPKSSRSILYTLEPMDDARRQEVFAQLQDSLFKELQTIRREVEALLSEKELSQTSQKTTALSERFRSLRSELRSLQRLAVEQQLYTPELLRQMEQFQKLLDAMDPQKAEQLQAQLQQPKDSLQIAQLREELQRAFQEWQEKLARMEALLPEYQQQRKMEELLTRLSDMVERQRQLSQLADSLQKGAIPLQSRLQKEAEALRNAIDSLRSGAGSDRLRDSLQKAHQELGEALNHMEEALEKMEGGKAPQGSQQNAADALERALQAMDAGMQQSATDEEAEEYEALRLLLKGILNLSFRQEGARKKAQEVSGFTAAAQPLITEQTLIQRDYKQVRDSLFALAHRSPAIEEPILDLLREIDRYFQGVSFGESEALIRRQQYILQGLNRLANLLTELLAQLEENQRQNRQGGGGACQRPFKVRRKSLSPQANPSQSKQGQRPAPQPAQKNAPTPSLQQLQRQLNEALERALTPNPAAETPGGLTPEERARLSAQQELIRLRLQDLIRQNPGEAGQLQSLVEEMQKAEKDLLIGTLTRERLMRQQAILTRLLEYERSQQERELDPSRESRTAQQFFQRITGSYPMPEVTPFPGQPHPALWLYHPRFQQLIEEYFR